MRRLLIALGFMLGMAAPAQAVSLHDLIDLSRSGLSDDILIAFVEAERSVFRLTPEDLKQLKAQGLSDRLLLHLLQTPALRQEAARVEAFERRLEVASREPARAPDTTADPEVVVVDRVETIAVPVYVPVPYWGLPDSPRRGAKPAAPVYWGWGGKRRPDSWKPSEKERDRR